MLYPKIARYRRLKLHANAVIADKIAMHKRIKAAAINPYLLSGGVGTVIGGIGGSLYNLAKKKKPGESGFLRDVIAGGVLGGTAGVGLQAWGDYTKSKAVTDTNRKKVPVHEPPPLIVQTLAPTRKWPDIVRQVQNSDTEALRNALDNARTSDEYYEIQKELYESGLRPLKTPAPLPDRLTFNPKAWWDYKAALKMWWNGHPVTQPTNINYRDYGQYVESRTNLNRRIEELAQQDKKLQEEFEVARQSGEKDKIQDLIRDGGNTKFQLYLRQRELARMEDYNENTRSNELLYGLSKASYLANQLAAAESVEQYDAIKTALGATMHNLYIRHPGISIPSPVQLVTQELAAQLGMGNPERATYQTINQEIGKRYTSGNLTPERRAVLTQLLADSYRGQNPGVRIFTPAAPADLQQLQKQVANAQEAIRQGQGYTEESYKMEIESLPIAIRNYMDILKNSRALDTPAYTDAVKALEDAYVAAASARLGRRVSPNSTVDLTLGIKSINAAIRNPKSTMDTAQRQYLYNLQAALQRRLDRVKALEQRYPEVIMPNY